MFLVPRDRIGHEVRRLPEGLRRVERRHKDEEDEELKHKLPALEAGQKLTLKDR
jgi:hypothetical protein